MRHTLLLVILSLTSTFATAKTADADKFRTKGAVALFWEACVHQYPDRVKFTDWMQVTPFKEFSREAAAGLVDDGGRAWAIDNGPVRYLLAAEDSNLCTVYMNKFEPILFAEAYEDEQRALSASRWIEYDKVERSTTVKGDVKYTTDQYKNHGDVVLNIIITEVKPGASFFELSMTATMKRSANKPLQPTAPKDGAPVER